MVTSRPDAPTPDELEVSIFGPGYGESVLIHVGNGRWVLVDSCLDPSSNLPAPTNYLRSLGVDVERNVGLVVATHWHDDHVRGISTIFRECKSAEFVISNALRSDQFLTLVASYRGPAQFRSSGLDEFMQVFQILETRKQSGSRLNPPKFALSNRLLWGEEIPLSTNTFEAKVFSLSPSDASMQQAILAFAELLPTEGKRKNRITTPTQNHASVVLWIQVGDHNMLLGADLENTGDTKTGWTAILNDTIVISGKAGVFKVAHHGAESAHDSRVWAELLLEEPCAILSPFSRGDRPLPTSTDIGRITNLTPNAYITSLPIRRQHRWTNRVVRDLLSDATRDCHSAHYGWGHIRLRQSIAAKSDNWQVELFGDALALRDFDPYRTDKKDKHHLRKRLG